MQGKRDLEGKVWMADERSTLDESALRDVLPSDFQPYVSTYCLPYDDIHNNDFEVGRGSCPKMINLCR